MGSVCVCEECESGCQFWAECVGGCIITHPYASTNMASESETNAELQKSERVESLGNDRADVEERSKDVKGMRGEASNRVCVSKGKVDEKTFRPHSGVGGYGTEW